MHKQKYMEQDVYLKIKGLGRKNKHIPFLCSLFSIFKYFFSASHQYYFCIVRCCVTSNMLKMVELPVHNNYQLHNYMYKCIYVHQSTSDGGKYTVVCIIATCAMHCKQIMHQNRKKYILIIIKESVFLRVWSLYKKAILM